MGKLYLPMNPNIDAATSSWLASVTFEIASDDDIVMVPATWDGSIMGDGDISIGLNVPKAAKGLRIRYGSETGKMKSCFSSLLEEIRFVIDSGKSISINSVDIESFSHLARYIDGALTSKGVWPKKIFGISFNPHMVDIGYIYESLRSSSNQTGEENKDLLDQWFEIMDSYLMKHRASSIARNEVDSISIEEHGGVKIACAIGSEAVQPQTICRFLFYRGADVVVYKDGDRIGAIRSRRSLRPDLSLLKDIIDEDGWHFYESGSMAARGTRSRPVESPSKYSVEKLKDLVAQISTKSTASL